MLTLPCNLGKVFVHSINHPMKLLIQLGPGINFASIVLIHQSIFLDLSLSPQLLLPLIVLRVDGFIAMDMSGRVYRKFM